MRVLSLYDSSPKVSSSAIASSNACMYEMIEMTNQAMTLYQLKLKGILSLSAFNYGSKSRYQLGKKTNTVLVHHSRRSVNFF